MSTQERCHCPSCTIRSLMGPAIVITIGVLFLLHEVRGGTFFFGNTWPVILIVIGAIQLGATFASREGHVEPTPPATYTAPVQPVTAPPSAPPTTTQNPYGTPGQ